jgi:hypothetical protein
MFKLVKIASGTHQQIASGELSSMLVEWTKVVTAAEEPILTHYGLEAGRSVVEVVPTLCYARIALSAFTLASIAEASGGDCDPGDPVEFGKRCEAIAREQIERYLTAYKTEGSA